MFEEPFSPDKKNNTAGRGILTLQGGKGVSEGGRRCTYQALR